MRALACDAAPSVRAAVAENVATPVDVLTALVADSQWRVRFAVSQNPGHHAVAVALAAGDPDVRGGLARRADLGRADIQALLRDPVAQVREFLAVSTTDPRVLAALAKDPHPRVRAKAALNRHVAQDDLEALGGDKVAAVRAVAAGTGRLADRRLDRPGWEHEPRLRNYVLRHAPIASLAFTSARLVGRRVDPVEAAACIASDELVDDPDWGRWYRDECRPELKESYVVVSDRDALRFTIRSASVSALVPVETVVNTADPVGAFRQIYHRMHERFAAKVGLEPPPTPSAAGATSA